jgi:hypothetical protein
LLVRDRIAGRVGVIDAERRRARPHLASTPEVRLAANPIQLLKVNDLKKVSAE